MITSRLGLTPLETAIDRPIGADPRSAPLPEVEPNLDPVQALEAAIRPALERTPCLIAFSGGRDSAALLAIATYIARRDGLPLPVPATYRFPALPETEESHWQEMVVRHLRLDDWHRRVFQDELDMLGPIARGVLSRHGAISPSNAFFFVPLLEDASGGTVVTGHEGDGLFGGGAASRSRSVLGGLVRPTPRDALRIAAALAPAAARRARLLRSTDPYLDVPWLHPAPRQDLRNRFIAEMASEPFFWNTRLEWWSRRRYVAKIRSALELLAADDGAVVSFPLLDPAFLAAMANRGGRWGFGDRTAVMRALFGSFLPGKVLARAGKAYFTRAHWNHHTRAFAQQWNGGGLPEQLVDPDRLRCAWTELEPDVRAGFLLHQAWLASGRKVAQ